MYCIYWKDQYVKTINSKMTTIQHPLIRTEGNVLFNDAHNTFYLRLRITQIVREETRLRHIGYCFRLAARVLLYALFHRQDNTYHGLCYTSRGTLAGKRNSSMGPPWRLDPTYHERTLLPRSYISLPDNNVRVGQSDVGTKSKRSTSWTTWSIRRITQVQGRFRLIACVTIPCLNTRKTPRRIDVISLMRLLGIHCSSLRRTCIILCWLAQRRIHLSTGSNP